jgi:hypothetical protein
MKDKVNDNCLVALSSFSSMTEIEVGDLLGLNSSRSLEGHPRHLWLMPRVLHGDAARIARVGDADGILFMVVLTKEEDVQADVASEQVGHGHS